MGYHVEEKPRKISKKRSCTDCFCFLIFVVFLIGLGVITLLTALDEGFDRLRYGYDSFGNICDKKNPFRKNQFDYIRQDTTGLKSVLYFDYLNPTKSKKTCVQTCPDQTLKTIEEFKNYTKLMNLKLCFYDVNPGVYDPQLCPKLPIFKSVSILNRCLPLPDIKDFLPEEILNLTNNTFIPNLYDLKLSVLELYKKLPDIGLLSLAGLFITILLVVFLRYISKFLVIVVLVLSALGSIALTVLMWFKYAEVRQLNKTAYHIIPLFGIELDSKSAYLLYSILLTIFTVVLILILIAMRKRIGLVLRLFAEAQKALADMPMLLGMPLITFTFLLMFLFYWVVTAIMIYSFGEYDLDELKFMNYSIPKKSLTNFVWVYHIVGLVWVSEFIFGCQSMIIAGSVSKWYFTRPKFALKSPIGTAFSNLIIYHLGSVALGSFIITLIRVPRYILMYMQDKIKASNSTIAQFLSKGCICCLWCLEKFMKYINYNAYTIVSIEGKSFCVSAQKAFSIIVENSLRVATINTVGNFILFLAKITVTGLTLLLGLFWFEFPFKEPVKNIDQYKFLLLPLLAVCIVAYLIAHCFFTVYEMVIDAIMVCFCQDCKANDGSDERPYYMSSSLKKFVDESSSTNIKY